MDFSLFIKMQSLLFALCACVFVFSVSVSRHCLEYIHGLYSIDVIYDVNIVQALYHNKMKSFREFFKYFIFSLRSNVFLAT